MSEKDYKDTIKNEMPINTLIKKIQAIKDYKVPNMYGMPTVSFFCENEKKEFDKIVYQIERISELLHMEEI